MKNFHSNQYNSLNIFNWIISSIVIVLIFCFFTEISNIFSSLSIQIIYICLKILPFVLIFCGLLITKYFICDRKNITAKNTPMQKTITIINITFYFLLIGFAFLFLSYKSDKYTYTNPKDYAKAINSIKQKEKISHFPKSIPAVAKKIQMYCYTSDNDGEIFILKFKINKEYIEQELKKHKFLNSDSSIGTYQDIYYIYTNNNRINVDNTTWYIINNEANKNIYPKYFPCYSSIGVSNNSDFIIYYYITPGD